ncbi:hypothetical protein D3C74_453030 [compost metagenome]
MVEVDTVSRHGHQRQAAETRGGDEGHFIHPCQRCAAEQGVVVVGGRREDGFGYASYREFGTALDFLVAGSHGSGLKRRYGE